MPDETPEQIAAREAALEDANATGEDDLEAPDDDVVVPAGAENPDAVQNAIKAERKKAREANARARDLERQLQERDEADKPLEDRIRDATKRADDADLRALRIEVAIENGLSLNLAGRLTGGTREELVADATVLAAEMGTPARPGLDGGYKQDPPKPKDPSREHSAFIGRLLGSQQSS